MLVTPFGNINLIFDGIDVPFEVKPIDNEDVAGQGESGERMEMTSIYQGNGKFL